MPLFVLPLFRRSDSLKRSTLIDYFVKFHGLTAVASFISGFRFVERNPDPFDILRVSPEYSRRAEPESYFIHTLMVRQAHHPSNHPERSRRTDVSCTEISLVQGVAFWRMGKNNLGCYPGYRKVWDRRNSQVKGKRLARFKLSH